MLTAKDFFQQATIIKVGDFVSWKGVESGFIKKIEGDKAYVVFSFNGDEEHWQNYTAEMCNINHLCHARLF